MAFATLTSVERTVAGVLLLLWAIFLFGGLWLGRPDSERTRRMPLWTRIASSITLTVAGWSFYAMMRGQAPLLIAVGMSLGLIGDLFMAKLIIRSDKHVLGGIGAFGLGHIAYIAAFLGQWGSSATGSPLVVAVVWGVWLIIGLAGWYLAVFRAPERNVLHWAALPYALLLASTAGAASVAALGWPPLSMAAAGGGLFLLSDLILAGQIFAGVRFPWIGDVVWLTYGPGQALLVYSILVMPAS
ncbi:MAG: lysoplasmalogenase [Anaerolineae bacterium]